MIIHETSTPQCWMIIHETGYRKNMSRQSQDNHGIVLAHQLDSPWFTQRNFGCLLPSLEDIFSWDPPIDLKTRNLWNHGLVSGFFLQETPIFHWRIHGFRSSQKKPIQCSKPSDYWATIKTFPTSHGVFWSVFLLVISPATWSVIHQSLLPVSTIDVRKKPGPLFAGEIPIFAGEHDEIMRFIAA